MNTNIAVLEIETPAANDILTIEPEQYVTAVYQPFHAELATAIQESAGVEYNITTTAGMAVAVAHRAKFRGLRLRTEEARKQRKAPILQIGKLLDDKAKELTAQITPHEERFDADIKAEERRKEAEKEAKLKAERERREAIEARIAVIRELPLRAANLPAASIAEMMDTLQQNKPDVSLFAEYLPAAEAAHASAMEQLTGLFNAALVREEEAKRLQAEREELERQRQAHAAEVERQRKEQARIDYIRENIRLIGDFVHRAQGKTFTQIMAIADKCAAIAITAEAFQEFAGEAEEAKSATLQKLKEMMTEAMAREAEEAERARQRAEHERLMAEQRAEQQRIAAELQRQQDELEAQQKAFREQQAAAQAEAQRKHELEAKEQEFAELIGDPEPVPIEVDSGATLDQIGVAFAEQFDLVAKKRTVWVNLYDPTTDGAYTWVGYPSQEEADGYAIGPRFGGKAHPIEIEE